MSPRYLCLALAMSTALLLGATPSWAFCNPDPTSGVSCLSGADPTCSQLGVSTMDGDRQNIVACLATPAGSNCAAGQCKWKAMTVSSASSGTMGPCYAFATQVLYTGAIGRAPTLPVNALDPLPSGVRVADIVRRTSGSETATLTCNSGYKRILCQGRTTGPSTASPLEAYEAAYVPNGCQLAVDFRMASEGSGYVGGDTTALRISCCKVN